MAPSPEWQAHELQARPPVSCASFSDSVLLLNHVHNPPNSPTTSSLCQHKSKKCVLGLENETKWQHLFTTSQYSLDPRFFVVQVSEELVQAVRLVQLGSASSSHALDFSKSSVNGITLIFNLRGVKGVAGHQAVSLAIEVLQTILEQHDEKCYTQL